MSEKKVPYVKTINWFACDFCFIRGPYCPIISIPVIFPFWSLTAFLFMYRLLHSCRQARNLKQAITCFPQ